MLYSCPLPVPSRADTFRTHVAEAFRPPSGPGITPERQTPDPSRPALAPDIEEPVREVLSRHFAREELRRILTPAPLTATYLRQEFPHGLALAIRAGRVEAGLNQKQLAESMAGLMSDTDEAKPGIASWVSKAEDRANPNLVRLAVVAGACRLPPSLLVRGAEFACSLREQTSAPEAVQREALQDVFGEFVRAVTKSSLRPQDRGCDAEDQGTTDARSAISPWKAPTPDTIDGFCDGVARTLRRYRYRAGLTLSEVVTRVQRLEGGVECSSPYVSQLETGAARPSIERLGLFATLYKVPLVSSVLRDAELVLAGGKSPGILRDLRDVASQLQSRVESLYSAIERGDVPPESMAEAQRLVPLIGDLAAKVGAIEKPARRPGRPRKGGGTQGRGDLPV